MVILTYPELGTRSSPALTDEQALKTKTTLHFHATLSAFKRNCRKSQMNKTGNCWFPAIKYPSLPKQKLHLYLPHCKGNGNDSEYEYEGDGNLGAFASLFPCVTSTSTRGTFWVESGTRTQHLRYPSPTMNHPRVTRIYLHPYTHAHIYIYKYTHANYI